MNALVSMDDSPTAADEIPIAQFENQLLTTLILFARAIRDHRRDSAAIRETLAGFILSMTPAERAL